MHNRNRNQRLIAEAARLRNQQHEPHAVINPPRVDGQANREMVQLILDYATFPIIVCVFIFAVDLWFMAVPLPGPICGDEAIPSHSQGRIREPSFDRGIIPCKDADVYNDLRMEQFVSYLNFAVEESKSKHEKRWKRAESNIQKELGGYLVSLARNNRDFEAPTYSYTNVKCTAIGRKRQDALIIPSSLCTKAAFTSISPSDRNSTALEKYLENESLLFAVLLLRGDYSIAIERYIFRHGNSGKEHEFVYTARNKPLPEVLQFVEASDQKFRNFLLDVASNSRNALQALSKCSPAKYESWWSYLDRKLSAPEIGDCSFTKKSFIELLYDDIGNSGLGRTPTKFFRIGCYFVVLSLSVYFIFPTGSFPHYYLGMFVVFLFCLVLVGNTLIKFGYHIE